MEFKKKAGELAVAPDGQGYMALLGTPDWVNLPAQLGGGRARVVDVRSGVCLIAGCNGQDAQYLMLDNGMGVSECTMCNQFGWFRPREVKDDHNEGSDEVQQ